MSLHVSDADINPLILALMSSLQHPVRLPDTGSVSKEYLEFPLGSPLFFLLNPCQQNIRIRPGVIHDHPIPSKKKEYINDFYPYKRCNHPANAIDQNIIAQSLISGHGFILHSPESQGDQGNDNEGVEYHRRENRLMKSHDIQGRQGRVRSDKGLPG